MSNRQELFNHMAQDHGLTLLETEMNDIAVIIERPLQARIDELESALRYIGDPKNGMADLPAVARGEIEI